MNELVPVGQKKTPDTAPLPELQQYLTFMLGAENFALPILNIKEIIEYGRTTAVPMTPAFIHGVINLRGAVVPVIDLAVRFGQKRQAITKRTCIVIIEISHQTSVQDIGIVVDAVNEVLDIPATEIEATPTFGASIRHDFIAGMGKVKGEFIIILDAGQVLSVNELSMLDNMTEQGVIE